MSTPSPLRPDAPEIDFRGEHRPDRKLLVLYFISSLALGPLFLVYLLPHAIRFMTLRYTFTDEGISVRWGILFRRETHLTYARIQDIHLRSHLLERWLGLGRLLIQTASGSSQAEMTIEGILQFEPLRDFIYRRSRGAGDVLPQSSARSRALPADALPADVQPADVQPADVQPADVLSADAHGHPGADDELSRVLEQIAGELRAIREALQNSPSRGPGQGPSA